MTAPRSWLWFVTAMAGIAIPRAAGALTFTVNATRDDVDYLAGDGVCETGPGNGLCTLRAAVQEANASGGPDTINLGTATYRLRLSGSGENASATGDLDVFSAITIVGVSTTQTIIDAAALVPGDRVFHVLPGGTLTMRALQLRGGNGPTFGGALFNQNGRAALDDVWVQGNSAIGAGGGIRNNGPSAAMVLRHCTIIDNTAPNGGGIANENDATLTMTNTLIDSNTGDAGGGVYNDAGATFTASTSTITNNVADGAGGGVLNADATANITSTSIDTNTAELGGGVFHTQMTGATLSIGGGTIDGNTALSAAGGGGVYASRGTVTIDAVKIRNNTASAGSGGGLALDPGPAAMQITSTTVESNIAAGNGGGIAYFGTGNVARIDHSLFDNNTATGDGGGLWGGSLGTSTIARSTFTRNTAVNGAGLYLNGQTATAVITLAQLTVFENFGDNVYVDLTGRFNATHTIFAQGTLFGADCAGGTLTSTGHNLINARACNYVARPTDVIGADPLLGALADNGGETWTNALTTASPAYNAGSANGCAPDDQRGAVAPALGRCDIGAYELQ